MRLESASCQPCQNAMTCLKINARQPISTLRSSSRARRLGPERPLRLYSLSLEGKLADDVSKSRLGAPSTATGAARSRSLSAIVVLNSYDIVLSQKPAGLDLDQVQVH